MRDSYSRRVRVLRVLLPLAAAALLLTVFMFPRSMLFEGLSVSGVRFDPAEGLRLLNPRYSGTTDDGQPFTMVADWALPDGPDPTLVTLGPLSGQLSLANGEVLTLEGAGGHFRPKDRTVRIEGGVTVTSSDGYRATLSAVDIDFAAGTMAGAGPVAGEGRLGTVTADTMRAARGPDGRYIWLDGRVRVVVLPESARAADPPGAAVPNGAAEPPARSVSE